MSLTLTVHRGTQQIGGSCIEIEAADGARLILDAGRPLDAPRDAKDLLPKTLDITRPANVIISHPHMDHWGLINELPEAWPVWTGQKSADLMKLSAAIMGDPIKRAIQCWHNRSNSFDVGGYSITPYLTDHSALDAYMLLIEKDGRRIFYTGDFRTHGRKAVLVDNLLKNPPLNIDALLMEGTNLNSDKPVITEQQLEEKFVKLIAETKGHIFVDWSAQNFDRSVTLYRSAVKTGRKLIVDLYTAEAMLLAASGTKLPRPCPDNFNNLQVVVTPAMNNLMRRIGRENLVEELIAMNSATSRKKIKEPAIIMGRKSLIRDYEKVPMLSMKKDDSFVHSNWSGYLDEQDSESGWAIAGARGARREMIHTSGHASSSELSRFACTLAPKTLIPVHGMEWDNPNIKLPPITRIGDGQPHTING